MPPPSARSEDSVNWVGAIVRYRESKSGDAPNVESEEMVGGTNWLFDEVLLGVGRARGELKGSGGG